MVGAVIAELLEGPIAQVGEKPELIWEAERGCQTVIVSNNGEAAAFIGGRDMKPDKGIPVPAGLCFIFDKAIPAVIYACRAGDAEVRFAHLRVSYMQE